MLKELLESAQLPAEFTAKAETLFEAAVSEQVASQLTSIQESFDKRLAEEKAAFVTESVSTLDKAIEETVLEWAKENAVALDNEIRGQLAESFLTGLKGLFEKADIELTGSTAADQIAKLTEQTNAAEKAAADAKAALVEAEQKLVDIKVKEIITEATAGLADTVASRAAKLCEAFDFKSEEDFRSKAAMIVEALGGKKIEGTVDADGVIIAVDKGADGKPAQVDTASGNIAPTPAVSKPADPGAAKPEDNVINDPVRESYDHLKTTYVPTHGDDMIAATLKLLK